MRNIFLFILVFCMVVSVRLNAQDHHDDHDDHDHGHGHGHHHSRNEIGFSGGAIYSFDHKEWGVGTHLHYYRTLGMHSKWSLGGMAEYVQVHGAHFTLGAGFKFQFTEKLGIGVLPGITFLSHDHSHDEDHAEHDKKAIFSAHFELVYDLFHWDKFHLGPVIDFSWSKNDSHSMIGIHAAFSF